MTQTRQNEREGEKRWPLVMFADRIRRLANQGLRQPRGPRCAGTRFFVAVFATW